MLPMALALFFVVEAPVVLTPAETVGGPLDSGGRNYFGGGEAPFSLIAN